jgi:hypothetical protein
MRFCLLLSIVLNAVLATAQPNLFQNQVPGSVGITGGQTAHLNVVYPSIPGIALQQVCSAILTISDDQGQVAEHPEGMATALGSWKRRRCVVHLVDHAHDSVVRRR